MGGAPDGRVVQLSAPKGGASALIFYSSECPISNAYSPTLKPAGRGSSPRRRSGWSASVSTTDLTAADVAAHAKDFGLKFPVVHDKDIAVATQVGATITPEAFVFDDQGRVRYHGRIDDQFAARQKRNLNPMTRELHDAIAAVPRRTPGCRVAEVPAVGCPISRPVKASSRPTYSGEVAAILEKNCLECHRRGQVGPVRARDVRAGPQACRRHRRGGRGPADAAVEGRTPGLPQVQARSLAGHGRHRHPRRLGRHGRPAGRLHAPGLSSPSAGEWGARHAPTW